MITLLINGVDQTHRLLRSAGWMVDKRWAVERFEFALFDVYESADAYRPVSGTSVYLTHDGDLLFGGILSTITDRRIDSREGLGVLSECVARDYMFLAEQAYVPAQEFAVQGVNDLFTALFDAHLDPRGCTNVSAPTGGAIVPALTIEKANTSLREVLEEVGRQCGWLFRINGDKWAAVTEPGSLPAPVDLTSANALLEPDVVWVKETTITANRLFMETGTPVTGPGPVAHHEDHVADGTATHFPVNVLPTAIEGSVNLTAGYAATATSMALADLPAGLEILAGKTFKVEGSAELHEVSSDVTVASDGTATVAFTPGLEFDTPNSSIVRFQAATFVRLELDGVATDIDGATWHFDELNSVIYTTGSAPAADVVVTYLAPIAFPAMVRVWDPLTVDIQASTGAFDFSVVIDGNLDGAGHTDLATAADFARATLTKRQFEPIVVTLVTRERGFYPLLTVHLEFPERLINDDFLVESVRIRSTDIDAHNLPITNAATQGELFYEITCVQGDALNEHESFVDYFKKQAA